jgi:hypothetical protein
MLNSCNEDNNNLCKYIEVYTLPLQVLLSVKLLHTALVLHWAPQPPLQVVEGLNFKCK